jgi:tetratricopeptide (TPR) repeat protein
VTTATDDAPYTLRSIQQMLGISRGVISGLIEAGFVAPRRGPRNEYRFTFQDVVLLRTAHGLQAADIPPRRILSSLRRLKASLPDTLPLTGLRITAVGKDIAVREGRTHWSPESGQLLMDFEVAPVGGDVAFLQPPAPPEVSQGEDDAQSWFERGESLEADDVAGAEAAYREALRLAPDHADAYLNLGAMLCEAGRCDEAVALYDEALAHCPQVATVHFNRAIALEDQGRFEEALASYEACLKLQPDLADAHFNAARLHERLGHEQNALRHFSAYRRLQR